MTEPQHLLLLEIQNFKRVEAFFAEFDANGGLSIITGENASGKTSALEALEAVATGTLPKEPLRRGAKKGRIIAKTEAYILTMRFTDTGNSYFELTNPEGLVYKSPRELWGKFVSARAFNPLAFASMRDKDMMTELLRICPVDLDLEANAAEAKRLYDERTIANRNAKRIEAALQSLPKPMENPPAVVSVKALSDKLEALREREKGFQKKRQSLKDLAAVVEARCDKLVETNKRISDLTEQLKIAKDQRHVMETDIMTAKKVGDALDEEVKKLPDLKPEADAIKAEIATAEQTNAAAEEARQQANAIADTSNQLVDARTEAAKLDVAIQSVQQERADALKGAKFPVEGLTIDDQNQIRLNGTLVEECSCAQRLKLGVELTVAASPTFRAACVDEGSALDSKNLAYLKELCEEQDLRLIVARVEQDDGEGVIRIENGTNKNGDKP